MKTISRREFIKWTGSGAAVIVIGSQIPWAFEKVAYAATTRIVNLEITDAIKEMATHQNAQTIAGQTFGGHDATCYFWVYKSVANIQGIADVGVELPAEVPGPTIIAQRGDPIQINLINHLDEPHAFFIKGVGAGGADVSVTVAPNATGGVNFVADKCGAFLYHDNLNAPVNRMMGLHGAIIVMPTDADRVGTNKLTPYGLNTTPAVQTLYNSFGGPTFPGLAWDQGDSVSDSWCPPMRQYVWLTHEASAKLFAEVGDPLWANDHTGPGSPRNPAVFKDKFLHGPFAVSANTGIPGVSLNNIAYTPQYFTINGQSGMFAHHSPWVTMMGRVGEPCIVHIMNAGLWTHSMHLHANHFWVTRVNDAVQDNPIWVDVFNVHPMDYVDYTVPYMRPPDTGNQKGIGPISIDEPCLLNAAGGKVWPPVEELNRYHPLINEKKAQGLRNGVWQEIDLAERQSPLCFPMHDHSEPSQTSQGGNYNTALISGIYFVGDRNTPGHMNFPIDEEFLHAYAPDFHMVMGGQMMGYSAAIRGFSGFQPLPPTPAAPPMVHQM